MEINLVCITTQSDLMNLPINLICLFKMSGLMIIVFQHTVYSNRTVSVV